MNRRLFTLLLTAMLVSSLLAACGGSPATESPAAESSAGSESVPAAAATSAPTTGRTQLRLWTHAAGNETELAAIRQMIADFNESQDQYEVTYEAFPQANYNDSVAAASVAGSLPCILDLDQPTVPNFAWSNYIQPLPVNQEILDDLMPTAVGTYKDEVYSLGQFDVALLIYARRSVLEKHDIRIPTLDQPWTLEEFNGVLETLKNSGEFEYPFDLNAQYTGEWWPYAYSPMLQSFGGDLIDRDTYLTAEGVLNGPEAVQWGEWFQDLFANGYANPTPADDQGFNQGRVALWYTGSWSADAVMEQVGDDALFLPTVDFGQGPKIGGASWQWGISANCDQPEGAWQFIEFLMQPDQIALMSKTTGLIPTSSKAAALTENYAEGGKYRIFFDMASRYAVLRPATPGYPTISSQFERAGLAIRDGGNVQDALDDAVDAINRDIEDNGGYGFEE